MLTFHKIYSWLASIASGLLVSLAFPGEKFPNLGLSATMPFAFVPLFFALNKIEFGEQKDAKSIAVRAALATWLFGVVVAGCSFFWITFPAILFGNIPVFLTYFGFAAYCALSGFYFLFVLLPVVVSSLILARRKSELPVFIIAGAATLLEQIAPRFFFWTFGSLTHEFDSINQWSSWFGFSIGTFFVISSGLYLARTLSSPLMARSLSLKLFVWIAAVSSVIAIGKYRLSSISQEISESRKVIVGYIQPNFTFAELASQPLRSVNAQQKSLETMLRMSDELLKSAKASPLDLIVWPESVVPANFLSSEFQRNKVTNFTKATGVPILLQATSFEQENENTLTHSISIVSDENGKLGDVYRKWVPMPFGESVPFENTFPWLGDLVRKSVSNVSKVGIGTSYDPLRAGMNLVAPLICFDSIAPELPRLQSSRGGADFFVNQANFVWMGDSNAGIEFSEIARYRAIENGRSLLLVSNTGPTVAFDPAGRELFNSTQLLTQTSGIVELPVYQGRSLFNVLGNWPLILFGIACWAYIARSAFFSRASREGGLSLKRGSLQSE